jgi:hypothetical protein
VVYSLILRVLAPLCTVLATSGCGDRSTPAAPTPFAVSGTDRTGPPFGPTGSFTLSGVTFATTATESQPVGGVTIYVDVTTPRSWYFFGTVKSDAAGRYSVTGLPEGLIHLWVYESGYAQTCITSVRVTGNAAADVELVPITTLCSVKP